MYDISAPVRIICSIMKSADTNGAADDINGAADAANALTNMYNRCLLRHYGGNDTVIFHNEWKQTQQTSRFLLTPIDMELF